MPVVNMRGLRDTRKLKAWLRAGKTIELRDRDVVIARIVPCIPARKQLQWPDLARLKQEILGDRVLSGSDLVIEERGRY